MKTIFFAYFSALLILSGTRITLVIASEDTRKPITLYTGRFPPYHFEKDGKVTGIVPSVLDCVFKKMNQPYQLRELPWLRAQKEVEQGAADGFFAAKETPERDAFAQASDPVVYRIWSWYVRRDIVMRPIDPKFKAEVLVGALTGTDDMEELKRDGYQVVPVTNSKLLVLLLKSKRIGAVRLVDLTMEEMLREVGENLSEYKVYFRGAFPNSCYFAKKFLKENPEFLYQFNKRLGECFNPKK